MTGLSKTGRSADDVIEALVAKRDRDVRWEDGRTFGMVYDGGPGVREVAERAASLYLHENALNTKAFPSLRDIRSMSLHWPMRLLPVAGSTTARPLRTICIPPSQTRTQA
jgi:glutamate/tyrosine decarboxylase-like PLP-dependent enzyme